MLHLIQGIVRLLLLCKIVFSAFAIWIYHSLGNVASKINKCFLIGFSVASILSWTRTELDERWRCLFSFSLLHCSKLWAETAATLKLFTHWTFYSPVKCSYNSKSCTTYWFLVLLCYWGYWTVAELFVLDIYLYKYLNYYNLNQYTNMNNILTYAFTNNVIVIHGFSSILSFLLSVHCANSAIFIPFTTLIVPFFFRSPR